MRDHRRCNWLVVCTIAVLGSPASVAYAQSETAPAPAAGQPAAQPADKNKPEPAGKPDANIVWYNRKSCINAMHLVVGVEFDKARRALMKLEARGDLEDKACAIYLHTLMAEMMIAVDGMLEAHVDYRFFYLRQMIAFGKKYKPQGHQFGDFEMDGYSRLVRAYFDAGEKMSAVGAARTANSMLGKRVGGEPSPIVDFVAGGFNSAVGHSSLPMRILFGMAGITGDINVGYKAVLRLTEGTTVFKYDAMYMGFHFGRESEDSPFGKPSKWAKRMFDAFPWNPQYIFDVSISWQKEGKCKQSFGVLNPVMARIAKEPTIWSPIMRSKIFWLASVCSLDLRDNAAAQKWAKRARKEGSTQWDPMLDDLDDAVY